MRAAALAALALVVGGAGSCGSTSTSSSTVTATGTNLKVYASVPAGAPGAADALAAEKLAIPTGGVQVGGFRVSLVPLGAKLISDNARTAIEDPSAIAYLGELTPGASRDSIGITNALDLLQVSPGDTALELTGATAAVPGAPNSYYESLKSYGRTFARVVPTTALEARAQVQEMRSLGVGSVYVTDDGSQYGSALAVSLRRQFGSDAHLGPPSPAGFARSGSSALFYAAATQNSATAARVLTSVAQSDPSAKLFVSSAVDPAALASALGSVKAHVYMSSPGFRPKDLPALGKQFVQQFTSTYGHAPSGGAIFAYEAAKAVLDVLREAGSSAADRAKIVHDFFSIRNRSSALGTYSINSDGDTSLGPFVFSRWQSGRMVPFTFLECQTSSATCSSSAS